MPPAPTSSRSGRRRFLQIVAGVPMVLAAGRWAAAATAIHRWRGTVLGGDAEIAIGGSAQDGAYLVGRCLAEIRRLEQVFTLYRAESELSRLNRDGVIENASPDLLDILSQARDFWRLTDGAFDVTVQPLWQLYVSHFADGPGEVAPAAEAIEAVLAKVGTQHLVVEGNVVRFARPNMAATLNGIAQGYITDRICDLLRAQGVGETLVNLGEFRALDGHPDGRSWRLGLRHPHELFDIVETVELTNAALATSGGYGYFFDAGRRYAHLLDPRTGRALPRYASLSVVAQTAVAADALSTAFSLMPVDAIAATAARAGVARVLCADESGNLREIFRRV